VGLGIVHDTWQMKAACRGREADLFYPPSLPERRDERDEREQRAKAICTTCSVRRACLDHALRIREQHGIWGGLTEAERRPLFDDAAAS
jgi:WhiB family transcriptional regulator, redox-sensing transcriptional regulator